MPDVTVIESCKEPSDPVATILDAFCVPSGDITALLVNVTFVLPQALLEKSLE